MSAGQRVTLVVGTDHHPFDRLVRWADQRQRERPQDVVTIQHGLTRAPEVATGHDLMHPAELRALMSASDVVITHGGPGTIADARAAGHQPLVVARNPEHGEHVDDHQMLFAAWAARKGLVRLVEGPDALDAALAALPDSGSRAAGSTESLSRDTTDRLVRLLDRVDGSRLPVAEGAGLLVHVRGATRAPGPVAALSRALASAHDLTVLGATELVWSEGVGADHACGCGAAFSQCPFWGEVGQRAFGGWQHSDAAGVRRLHDRLAATRPPAALGRRHPGKARRALLLEHAAGYRRLADAAREVSGRAGVVDASVAPVVALSLAHDRHVDLRVVRVSGAAVDRPVRGRDWSESALMSALAHRGVPRATVAGGRVESDPQGAVRDLDRSLRLGPAPVSPSAGQDSPAAAHVFPAGWLHPPGTQPAPGKGHR